MRGLLFVAILACGCERDRRATTTADPWGRLPPMELLSTDDKTVLGADRFAVVSQDESKALTRLADSPWVKVSPEEAMKYTGKAFDEPGGELVLLRALSLNEGTGKFEVTWRAGAVRVHHGSLGRHAVPQKRRAIVARLPALPAEVYVTCSMAE